MAERQEGRSAQKREWTVQEILDQMALCVDDDHCAEHCAEEPCVLQDTAFLCSIARGLQVQRAEIEAQRRANEGHRVMVASSGRSCKERMKSMWICAGEPWRRSRTCWRRERRHKPWDIPTSWMS